MGLTRTRTTGFVVALVGLALFLVAYTVGQQNRAKYLSLPTRARNFSPNLVRCTRPSMRSFAAIDEGKPIYNSMHSKRLTPAKLVINDDSRGHVEHEAMVGKAAESSSFGHTFSNFFVPLDPHSYLSLLSLTLISHSYLYLLYHLERQFALSLFLAHTHMPGNWNPYLAGAG
eukprot:1318467-Amorphochlora_amoeboformis.AAC.1